MRFKYIFFIFIVVSVLASCQKNKPKEKHPKSVIKSDYSNDSFQKLAGKWYKLPIQEDKNYIENWDRTSKTSFAGDVFILNNLADEKFNSKMLWLNYKNSEWVYTIESSDHIRTDFIATTLNDSVILFENKNNNFPKFIEYYFLSQTHLQITIGNNDKTLLWEMEKQ